MKTIIRRESRLLEERKQLLQNLGHAPQLAPLHNHIHMWIVTLRKKL